MTRPTESSMFDQRIADWLEDDPTVAPPQLLETVRAAAPSIPQRTAGPAWWIRPRWGAARFAFAAVFIAAVGVVGLWLLRVPSVGPQPSPTPVITPAFGLSGAMVPFTSPQYGYSIDRPMEWTVREATEGLVELGAPWIDSAGVDYTSRNPAADITATPGIILGAARLSSGRTLAEWTDLVTVATCGAPASRVPIEVAGDTGELLEYAACYGLHHLWATVVHDGAGYHVVWIGPRDTEAADRVLFDRVIATFRFPANPLGTVGPSPVGQPLLDVYYGAWHHSAPSWMWFLRAGDQACITFARTDLDCMIWQPEGKAREVGVVTRQGNVLTVRWLSGYCSGVTSTYTATFVGSDGLTLTEASGGCEGGNLALTRAGTGSAPTAPPQPTP